MDPALTKNILAYIQGRSAPVAKKDLVAAFGLGGPKRLILKAILKNLVAQGAIIRAGNRFGVPGPQAAARGGPKTDRLDRETIVGLIETIDGMGSFLIPSNRRLRLEIPITRGPLAALKNGHIVQARVEKRGRRVEAHVQHILGMVTDPGMFAKIAIVDFQLPDTFAPDEIAQAAQSTVPALGNREDLRDLSLVTIDDASARDFDDAVWAAPDTRPHNPGGWHLVVAIADVAHYVRPGDPLDRAAQERGNSVYLPDCVLPMLPEGLSNGLCSLRPHEPRACLAVHLYIDAQGERIEYRFCRGLMQSHARLTYKQVQQVIDAPHEDHGLPVDVPVIQALHQAYQALRGARTRRGALDLEIPEAHIVVDEHGHFQHMGVRERLAAHALIEEFMVSANVAAAEFLQDKGIPLLYRSHNEPSADKLLALQLFLKRAKLPHDLGIHVTPHRLNAIVDQTRGSASSSVIQTLILRSQAQAMYTPKNAGHYGLGLAHYCHFTSPIRRYADLVVHRGLLRAMGDKGPEALHIGGVELEELGQHLSDRERRAVQAERDTQERYIAQYLKPQVGDTFAVVITGVAKFGLFLTIAHLNATGFCPAAVLPGDFYLYDEKNMRLVGRRNKRSYALGQALNAQLVRADAHTGSIEFAVSAEGLREKN